MSYWTQVDLLGLNRVYTFERKQNVTNCQITSMYKGDIFDLGTIGENGYKLIPMFIN